MIADRPDIRAFQDRRGNYSETELREWAARIRSWPVTESFVYFNNDWEGFAPQNARRLRRLLQSETDD